MEALAEKRKDSKGNYGNWDSTIKHLKSIAREIFNLTKSINSLLKALESTY